jgi:hypothetical protein
VSIGETKEEKRKREKEEKRERGKEEKRKRGKEEKRKREKEEKRKRGKEEKRRRGWVLHVLINSTATQSTLRHLHSRGRICLLSSSSFQGSIEEVLLWVLRAPCTCLCIDCDVFQPQ